MSERFYTILTSIGKTKITKAYADKIPLELKAMGVGDGGGGYYNPAETMTGLKNETYRRDLNTLSQDPDNANYLIAEMVIPADLGGFYIREAAIFDIEGDMIAIGKIPETYKPTLDTGAGKDVYIRFIVEVSSAESVTLKINPSIVLATKEMAEIAATNAVTAHVLQVNPHNQYVMKKDYTAEDMLAKLITVDGAGSKLDADTLDGLELAAIQNLINAKQPSGDYATNTALNSGLAGKATIGHNHSGSQFLAGNGDAGGFSFINDGGYDTGMYSASDGDLYFKKNNVRQDINSLLPGVLSISKGGTGAADASGARNNLQIPLMPNWSTWRAAIYSRQSNRIEMPAGGTWAYVVFSEHFENMRHTLAGVTYGGAVLSAIGSPQFINIYGAFCWRIA